MGMTTSVRLTVGWMLNSAGLKRYSLLKTQTWNRGSLWDGNGIFATLRRVAMSEQEWIEVYDAGGMNGVFGRLTDQTIEMQTAETVAWITGPIGRAD